MNFEGYVFAPYPSGLYGGACSLISGAEGSLRAALFSLFYITRNVK